MGYKGDKTVTRPPEGSLVETSSLKASSLPLFLFRATPRTDVLNRLLGALEEKCALALTWVLFVAASHQTRLDTRSKARRPIKVGIKGRGRSGTSRDSNPAGLCCSSAHLVKCERDEGSSFTKNPNVGPGKYASLRLKLDARSSAIHGLQRRQNCSTPTRG